MPCADSCPANTTNPHVTRIRYTRARADWYDRWPVEALQSVARQFLEPLDFGEDQEVRETVLRGLIDMSSVIHTSVITNADKFFAEQKRKFYVTPKSFLELISLYLGMLDKKRAEMMIAINRLEVGCAKINETKVIVTNLEAELTELQPILEVKSKETEALLIQVNKDRAAADEKKAIVSKEEAAVPAVPQPSAGTAPRGRPP